MLIAEWTKQDEVSRGPSVVRHGEHLLVTTSGDPVPGYGGFVSTTGLVGVPAFVLQVSRPSPYAQVVAQLEQLVALASGWDGHDGARVDPESVTRAMDFLNQLHNLYPGLVSPPLVGPLPDGGVALVWRTEKKEVEINFVDRGNTIESAVTDRNDEHPEEFQERVQIDFLLSDIVPDHLIG